MSFSTLLNVILLFVVFMASLSARRMSHRIWCSYRRADRTKLEQWAKENQKVIIFDGGKYHVEPSRVVLKLYTGGIHILFPTWVRCLDYRHDSARALHPDTFENSFTAEERQQLDASDDIAQLLKGSQQAMIKPQKQLLGSWMPIIVIVGFLIVGWLIYSQQGKIDMLGNGQNYIEQQMGQILQKMK